MLTPSEISTLIAYNSATGEMTWKPRASKRWNTAHAGKPAFANLSDGYLTGRALGVNYKAHRVAWAIHHGEWPIGMIDHINGNPTDNHIENLRVVSPAGNAQNQRVRSNNTSGEQGITWFPRDSKWWVKLTKERRVIHIGYYENMRDAVIARDAAYKAAGFHKNHGRR
jgi:hypothetical protein